MNFKRPQNFTNLHRTYIWHKLYFPEGETSNEPRLDASGEVGHFIWRRFVGMGTCGSGSSLGGFRRTWPVLSGREFVSLEEGSFWIYIGNQPGRAVCHCTTTYEFFLFAECTTYSLSDSRYLRLLSCNLTLTWLPKPFGDLLVASSATEMGPSHQGNFVTEAVNMLCSLLYF